MALAAASSRPRHGPERPDLCSMRGLNLLSSHIISPNSRLTPCRLLCVMLHLTPHRSLTLRPIQFPPDRCYSPHSQVQLVH